MTEEEFKLEESFLADVIFGASDVSQFVKWPLFLLSRSAAGRCGEIGVDKMVVIVNNR